MCHKVTTKVMEATVVMVAIKHGGVYTWRGSSGEYVETKLTQ